MTRYLIRRLLLLPPTLLGMTALVFLVMANSPGGVAGQLLGELGEMEAAKQRAIKEYYEKRYGLDDPWYVQYGRWLNQVSPIGWEPIDSAEGQQYGAFGLKWPNLGRSFVKGREVTALYAEALPITLLLSALSLPLVYGTAVLSGVYAARHRGKLMDVGSGVTLIGLWSVPTIVTGVLMIGLLANKEIVQLFPANGVSSIRSDSFAFLPSISEAGFERGWLLDRLWHLVLPVTCLTYGSIAIVAKLTRSSMLDSLSADYVRTARAKGLDDRVVLWRHAFRNSLLPLITNAAHILPNMIAGSVIIESIFGIPGMGRLTIEAINARDREVVLAGAFVAGVLTTVSVLIADICYCIADPRVAFEDA